MKNIKITKVSSKNIGRLNRKNNTYKLNKYVDSYEDDYESGKYDRYSEDEIRRILLKK